MKMKLMFLYFGCFRFTAILSTKDEYYLMKIDNLIIQKLTNPIPGEGDYVLDSLSIYNQELNATIQNYTCSGSGQDIVDSLIKQKGPACATLHVKDHLLQAGYGWDVKELGELYHLLCNTQMLWRQFRIYLNTKLGYEIDPPPSFFETTVASDT